MPIDIIFLAVLGYGFWIGYNRGIISTVMNILLYAFGITLSFKLTPVTTNILERLFNTDNPSLFMAAFIVNMALLMFVMRQAVNAVEGALRVAYLGFFNRALGGALVGGFGVLIYSVLIWFLVKVHFLNDATLRESRMYERVLEPLPGQAKSAADRMLPYAQDIWDTVVDWMDRVEKYGNDKVPDGKKEDGKPYKLPDDGRNPIFEDYPQDKTPAKKQNNQGENDNADTQ
ncbi:MAG: CvpA family protein [Chitinophagales bacterium]|nr:CvpA family protein [Chitinophagales bacterium]